MGDRKGLWSIKTSALKPFGMVVNISGLKCPVATKSYSLSCEDAQDKDDWRLRIKGH